MSAAYMFPTTAKEVEALGWDYIDIIIFTGDAFIDHPAFGTAMIARYLQHHGYRIAIVPQPNWRDDLRDFRKLGAPRLFFGVNSGAMDSMVNHYTASKRLRSDDAYTPEGRAGMRPDRAVTVYTKILKELYPDIPVVIGGVEASLRRFTHYDYWADSLMPSVLVDSGADYLCYGMGERPMLELARAVEARRNASDIAAIPQIAFYRDGKARPEGKDTGGTTLFLASYERCLKDRRAFAENFHKIETAANMLYPPVVIEPVGKGYVRVNPPYPPATEQEMDSFYDLPYTKLPHPKYKGKRIPAYDMIRFSITTQRLFRRLQFLHYSGPPGKIHTKPFRIFNPERSRRPAFIAGIRRKHIRFGSPDCQHVRHERQGTGHVRQMPPQIVPFPIPVPQSRPLA